MAFFLFNEYIFATNLGSRYFPALDVDILPNEMCSKEYAQYWEIIHATQVFLFLINKMGESLHDFM